MNKVIPITAIVFTISILLTSSLVSTAEAKPIKGSNVHVDVITTAVKCSLNNDDMTCTATTDQNAIVFAELRDSSGRVCDLEEFFEKLVKRATLSSKAKSSECLFQDIDSANLVLVLDDGIAQPTPLNVDISYNSETGTMDVNFNSP